MSKTSSTVNHSSQNFIPKELSTPNKESPGVSKTVFTHVSNLHGLIYDWARFKDKGVKLCRAIVALKLYECTDDYYPHQVQPLMESLVEALDGLKNIVEGVKVLESQLRALAQLHPSDDAVISTWSVKNIFESVEYMSKTLQKELQLKEVITENIAHCRNEKLIDVYVSSWELEPYFECDTYLFAEVGLPAIT